MTLFDHQNKEGAFSAPPRTTAPLLPNLAPQTAAHNLITLVPKAMRDGSTEHLNQTLDTLQGLYDAWQLPQVAKLYGQETGRSLLNDLLDVFEPWIDVRHDVARVLQGLVPNLTWNAFLEQLAYGAAYAQRDDMEDAKGGGDDTNMRQVIKAAGFQAGPLIRGRWGLQFRTFRPLPSAFKQRPVVIFRGTEGVKPPLANPLNPAIREGMVDTWIGDFTRMGAGYPQYEANKTLIKRNMTALGQSAVTGHSLGGGLAQIVMAKLPALVSECVTFNAPGIKAEDAKALEKEKIPTTHHRTTRDVVPIGNSQAAPGTIMTYERLIRGAPGSTGWVREKNLLLPHNHMSINGLLNYEQKENLTPLQQTMRTVGANGPTPSDQQDAAITALVSVKPTSQDRMIHAGEKGLDDSTTYATFRANLGYNLLVEVVEQRVAKLNPKGLNLAQIDEQLQELQAEVMGIDELPVSTEAYRLFDQMGLKPWETFRKLGNVKTVVGAPVAIPVGDRRTVAGQVRGIWTAWWPGARQ
ncbi:hypothetical protein ACFFLM_17995 [Deinococcus oregonensis]|uniref:Fungal lipase-like domain-containing protein n=1 Tax=Deinococcus oregonensis TaxID=1805970 RepID=A0ABV6B262_9DEIO